MLENRKSQRTRMVLPVKISVENDTLLAHTLDISSTGARLGALRTQLQPGTIVRLRRGTKKANFQVQWVKQIGPNEVQVGVECMEPQENFWGINFFERNDKQDMYAFMSVFGTAGSTSPPKGIAQ